MGRGAVTMSAGTAVERAERIIGPIARRDVALSGFTTFRVGGPAALLVRPDSEEDLERVATACRSTGLPVLVVGQGSNLLVADAGFPGIVVVLGDTFSRIAVDPVLRRVTAGGAVKLPVLARRTVAAGLTGLEWAVGVPGSVGGAVCMNAGGHGSDTAANLVEVRVIDLDPPPASEDASVPGAVTVSAADLHLGYRTSSVDRSTVVVHAMFQLAAGDVDTGEAELSEIVRWRREHQPGGANCGSVFTNPPGQSAGRLIDEAGLKGHRVGSASVSEKHANFIQADENASAQDICALINYVRSMVFGQTGIALHPEVRTAGFVEDPFQEMP